MRVLRFPAAAAVAGFHQFNVRRAGAAGFLNGLLNGLLGPFPGRLSRRRGRRIMRQGFPGRGALGVRLFGSGALSQDGIPGRNRHGKYRLVVGAGNGYHLVAGRSAAPALHHFLQLGLGVFRRGTPAAVVGQLRRQRAEDEPAGRLIPLIQVNRRHHRLKDLFQDGLPLLAAGTLFSLAQGQVIAQGQAAGHPGQAGAADQSRPALGQLPLGYPGQSLVKLGGNHQLQDGIPQELHTLVGVQTGAALFVEKRAMNQGLLQQAPVLETQS